MTNERAIQILENLISINGDIIIGDEGREALEMAIRSLQQEQNSIQDTELTGFESALFTAFSYAWQSYLRGEEVDVVQWVKDCSKDLLEAAECQQEQQEIDLEKFTKKMDAWKARYNNYPDNIIVKGTMAFTARMFYMYPNVARKWYDSLPKVTLD